MTTKLRLILGALLLATLTSLPAVAQRGEFGDHLSRPHYAPDRTVDVEHYRLEMAFDPENKQVSGQVSIRFTAIRDSLTTVELDAGPMEIDAVVLDEMEEASDGLEFQHDGETLRVELPRALRSGETVTLTVRYTARPQVGLYFVGPDDAYPDRPAQVWSQGEAEDNHHWFPSFDFPNDRATSEEIYTVPADWTAVGNGEFLGVEENPGGRTRSFHYRMDVPHVSYLVSVVAGRMERYTDDLDGLPIEYYVPEGTGEETARRSFDLTPAMMRFFNERIGVPYPYASYTQSCAVDFIWGGMENIGATTQSAETLHDATASLDTDSWGLVAHELAHQWFGDLLTCADWSHAWLNESFATYWENLWREHHQGRDEFQYQLIADRDAYLEEDRERYRRALVEYRYTDPMDLFDSHLYPKGSWILHMMRGVLGDEAFFKAINHYVLTYREQVVETEDLRKAMSQATGVNMTRYFDQWVYHGGHLELQVTRDWDPDAGILTLHFAQTQELDDKTPLYALPLHVAVDTTEGTVHRVVRLERASHDLTVRLDGEPLLVRIDPDFQVLMELDHQRPVAEMLRALSLNPSVAGRILVARDLAKRATAVEATPDLAAALADDPFYGVRAEAAKALGELRGDAARDALIRAVRADPEARVRAAAASALGSFREDDVAAAALEDSLGSERAYGTQAAAVLALGKMDAPGARQAARRALQRDSHRERVRAAALEALGEMGNRDDIPLVREWIAYGKPPRARQAAVAALAVLARAEEHREELVEQLIELLDDRYIWVRRAAIEGLGELHASEALDRLERSAQVEVHARLRKLARASVQQIREAKGSGKSVAELNAELEELRAETRRQAHRIEELEKRVQ
ncbi:MAG: peptidase M1 [Acidobacteria bacterium]|nr:MAG: peptidase M1 [Acidobacteriota bacterium]